MIGTNLNELTLLITPRWYDDQRSFFSETYSRKKYLEMGIDIEFVEDNHSLLRDFGTLRSLHFQAPPHVQGKIMRCGRNTIFDVAGDIRRGSQNYGQWFGYLPMGFAHGFETLEPDSEIVYKFSGYYAPETEGAMRWDDPDIGIDWHLTGNPILSEKDALAPSLKDFESPFIFGENS